MGRDGVLLPLGERPGTETTVAPEREFKVDIQIKSSFYLGCFRGLLDRECWLAKRAKLKTQLAFRKMKNKGRGNQDL